MTAASMRRATRRSRPPGGRKGRRSGFTVVELVVTVAILGIVASLVLPAIQSARAASRRLTCANNLKQLALAATYYEAVHGQFVCRDINSARHLSISLTPAYLDLLRWGGYREGTGSPLDVCPSDELATASEGFVNYVASDGVAATSVVDARARGVWTQVGIRYVGPARPAGASDVSDGLSQTALLSERLVHGRYPVEPGWAGDAPERSFHQTNAVDSPAVPTAETLRRECLSLAAGITSEGGLPPDNRGGNPTARFDHLMPPNGLSCLRGRDGQRLFGVRNFTASSRHPGGVNVATLDGAVSFVADGVSQPVWWSLGTIAGLDPGSQW